MIYRIDRPGKTRQRPKFAPYKPGEPATTEQITMLPLIKFSDLDLLHPRIEHASRVLIETAEANMRGIPTGCVLAGPHGVGKTTLAMAAVWHAGARVPWLVDEEDGRLDWSLASPVAQYIKANELINKWLDPKNDYEIDWQERGIPFTVIDDVGLEQTIQFMKDPATELQRRYYQVLDYAAEGVGHGLIITTNRSIDPAANALRAMLGEANWSRILKLCPKGSLVDLNGLPDRRVVSSGR